MVVLFELGGVGLVVTGVGTAADLHNADGGVGPYCLEPVGTTFLKVRNPLVVVAEDHDVRSHAEAFLIRDLWEKATGDPVRLEVGQGDGVLTCVHEDVGVGDGGVLGGGECPGNKKDNVVMTGDAKPGNVRVRAGSDHMPRRVGIVVAEGAACRRGATGSFVSKAGGKGGIVEGAIPEAEGSLAVGTWHSGVVNVLTCVGDELILYLLPGGLVDGVGGPGIPFSGKGANRALEVS